MSDLVLLSDEELAIRLHDTMERHDRLIDSCDMGDERIYLANKECEAIKDEQKRRGYRPCAICFDFGDVTDMHHDFYGFCKCPAGARLRDKSERQQRLRAALAKASPQDNGE